MTKTIFTPEIQTFIKKNVKGLYNQELADLVNKNFNTSYTAQQIKYFKEYKQLKSGVGCTYGDSYIRNDRKPIGTERIRNGYIEIKVAQPCKYIPKGRYIYEKYYGAIPKGYKIIYLDGNRLNCSIENLACVNDSEMCLLNHYGKRSTSKDLTKTQLLNVKLYKTIKEKKKNGKTI